MFEKNRLSIEEIKNFRIGRLKEIRPCKSVWNFFLNQKISVENQIEELKKSLEII